MTRNVLKAPTPADLIAKVRKVEGWTKVEGGQLADIRRMNSLYVVTADCRRNLYVATPKGDAA